MAYKYCVRKKADNISKDKPVKYYAVPVSESVVGTKQLSKIISDRCTLTGTDVAGCLDALAYVIQREINNGNKVRLDGIGVFGISATSPGFDTPEECIPGTVKAKRICYLPSKDLKDSIKALKFTRID